MNERLAEAQGMISKDRLIRRARNFFNMVVPSYVSDILNYTQYIRYSQGVEQDKIELVMWMITYRPFYETLLKKGITEYQLIFKQGLSANTLHRMKHGEAISTKTLNVLCEILECGVSDIIEYVPDEE